MTPGLNSIESAAATLHSAARDRDMELVIKLLEDGADINAQDENGDTPMIIALGVSDGGQVDIDELEEWIWLGADPSVRNNNGRSVWAACSRIAQDCIHFWWRKRDEEDARKWREHQASLRRKS